MAYVRRRAAPKRKRAPAKRRVVKRRAPRGDTVMGNNRMTRVRNAVRYVIFIIIRAPHIFRVFMDEVTTFLNLVSMLNAYVLAVSQNLLTRFWG